MTLIFLQVFADAFVYAGFTLSLRLAKKNSN
jgi:hypothetical protein